MVKPYLKSVDLRKDLRSEVLFSGVSLEISVKSWILITGSSASGKTTLLRLLFGEGKPNFGYVEKRKNLRRLKIEHELICHKKTIRQSLTTLGHKFGLRGEARSKRIEELAVKFNFKSFLDQNVATLSDSIKQLASLAQAFLVPLDLIAFDEPLVYLTQDEVKSFRSELNRFHELGVAIVVVAADAHLFEPDATKVYELSHANLKLIYDQDFVDLMRPHLIFKREPFAEKLPDYLLANSWVLKDDQLTLDLIAKPDEVNEIVLELIKRGYSLKYLREEII
ncbi:ATP-binding cassette domain-containing protein [Xylocopilactobacillus apicola]|uniref:ABC transporter domain-containing protein n=1 Tax=Xylocopilactobacillus apicola TaxID=2932184 RepID=A0AAU9D772_9LACO|nr:ATP-binding cassette domain-containing protein [Xylocopilactobacillus apicola]BDR59724.1 hypothetical protein XA3_21650 [Xylocopilactobacillus apicola]